MAKRVVWSEHALADRISILDYWSKRLGNKNYSRKLDRLIRKIVSLLRKFPNLGHAIGEREIKVLVKSHYHIYYKCTDNDIQILHLWDSRRNPEDLNV